MAIITTFGSKDSQERLMIFRLQITPQMSESSGHFYMEPYIKSSSPLRGGLKPGIKHGPGQPRIERRQKEEVASTRRALRKAARREGRKEIEEADASGE